MTPRRRLKLACGVGGAVLAGLVVAANWPRVELAAAMAIAERRPALLSDARWGRPVSAVKFARRFAPGTKARDLVGWLEANRFRIDAANGRARRLVRSLPCNEGVDVTWRAGPDGRLVEANAAVSEAGCL